LVELCRAKDLKVFAVIDQAAEARQVGLDLRETVLVVFGNPAAGTPVMAASPLSALDLPLKVLIWADPEHGTQVSYTDPAVIAAEMDKITESREATQPIKSRTGGSTFKNPPDRKAWQLIDAAGCRGLKVGDAQVSEMHCNFLINRGGATAADIEALGENVRRRVKETSGVELEWEIERLGVPVPRD